MEYHELKNWDRLWTPKPSARVLMASFTTLPRELGFIGTPKFVATLAAKERSWKKKRFKAVEERGLTDEEFLEGIRYTIAFYAAMIAACGKEKTSRVYPKLTEKLGVMMYEDFIPSSKDFMSFRDPWEAIRLYFRHWFMAWGREGVAQLEIVQDTDSDFQVHVTDCAWHAIWSEAGYPELAPISQQTDLIFLPRLMGEVGGDFKRQDGCLCLGDPICDWHFFRHKGPD